MEAEFGPCVFGPGCEQVLAADVRLPWPLMHVHVGPDNEKGSFRQQVLPGQQSPSTFNILKMEC